MAAKQRILCVDDHSDTCDLISLILNDYEVVPSHSKGEALLKATGDSFDLYLLDYYLPDGTGLELCLLLRDFDLSTPVLFVTSEVEITPSQIESVKAQGLVLKANLPEALVSAVANIFQ
jgi:CheY-like chemotaxis protein